jgi:YbbR domain-containing protein
MIAFLRDSAVLVRDFVQHDFLLKVFSFALAVLIWFTVTEIQKEASPLPHLTMNSDVKIFSNLPVVVMSSAQDVRNFKVNPSTVEVTVQGDAKTLRDLSSKDIRVIVDLTGIEGTGGLRKRIEVSTPSGVTHKRVEPEEVEVRFPLKPPGNQS